MAEMAHAVTVSFYTSEARYFPRTERPIPAKPPLETTPTSLAAEGKIFSETENTSPLTVKSRIQKPHQALKIGG
jgi:hypothetical protein